MFRQDKKVFIFFESFFPEIEIVPACFAEFVELF